MQFLLHVSKRSALSVVCFFLASALVAQTSNQPFGLSAKTTASLDKIIQIEDIKLDATDKTVSVQIVNVGTKTITAFSLGVIEIFADGSRSDDHDGGFLYDMGPLLAIQEAGGQLPAGTLLTPRTRMPYSMTAGASPRGKPISVQVMPIMVVLDDNSAIGDNRDINRVVSIRQELLANLTDTLTRAQTIKTATNPVSEIDRQRVAPKPGMEVDNGNTPPNVSRPLNATVDHHLAALRQLYSGGHAETVAPFLDAVKKQRDSLSNHVTISIEKDGN